MLYTVPKDEDDREDGPSFGEAVNGSFVAGTAGFLFVTVEGNSDVLDLWGSQSVNGPGWQIPPNLRQGVEIDELKCFDMNAGQKFKFNVRAGKGIPPNDLHATFDWFWWDSTRCCLQHDVKVLNVRAKPMRLIKVEPLIPQLTRIIRIEGEDLELLKPDCPRKDNPGNMTNWFIMWPTTEGQVIQEGHAKGWKVDGNTLIAPGPDGRRYVFGTGG